MENIFDNIKEVLREYIEQISLMEAKSAEAWWDRLPGKRKAKVVGFLALDKKSGKKIFSKLDADERSEIEAYFVKHKGKVEGVENGGKSLEEAKSNQLDKVMKQSIPEWVTALEEMDAARIKFSASVLKLDDQETKHLVGGIRDDFKAMRKTTLTIHKKLSKEYLKF